MSKSLLQPCQVCGTPAPEVSELSLACGGTDVAIIAHFWRDGDRAHVCVACSRKALADLAAAYLVKPPAAAGGAP